MVLSHNGLSGLLLILQIFYLYVFQFCGLIGFFCLQLCFLCYFFSLFCCLFVCLFCPILLCLFFFYLFFNDKEKECRFG